MKLKYFCLAQIGRNLLKFCSSNDKINFVLHVNEQNLASGEKGVSFFLFSIVRRWVQLVKIRKLCQKNYIFLFGDNFCLGLVFLLVLSEDLAAFMVDWTQSLELRRNINYSQQETFVCFGLLMLNSTRQWILSTKCELYNLNEWFWFYFI